MNFGVTPRSFRFTLALDFLEPELRASYAGLIAQMLHEFADQITRSPPKDRNGVSSATARVDDRVVGQNVTGAVEWSFAEKPQKPQKMSLAAVDAEIKQTISEIRESLSTVADAWPPVRPWVV